MANDDFKLTEHREILKLHFMPAVLRQNLRTFIDQTKEAIEKSKNDEEKKQLTALLFFYEDVFDVICWAFSKLAKAPKSGRNGKKKRQDS